MDWLAAPEWWWGRLVLERGIAVVYVIAFVGAARQFRGLIGTHGMLPVPNYLARRTFRSTPSLFHLHYSDRFFAAACWVGAAVSAAMAIGLADAVPLWLAMLVWLALWALYLSIVNVGQMVLVRLGVPSSGGRTAGGLRRQRRRRPACARDVVDTVAAV